MNFPINQEQILEATNGGLDIILRFLPEARLNKHFKIRHEGTESANLSRRDGVYFVKLKNLSDEDATTIMKKHYWDRWKADQIKDQRVANTLVDWLWCSGAWGIKIPQKILGLKVDGIVGEKTITAVNNAPANFLQALYKERQEFLERIAKTNPTQKRFLKGWMNRINDLKKWNERFLK